MLEGLNKKAREESIERVPIQDITRAFSLKLEEELRIFGEHGFQEAAHKKAITGFIDSSGLQEVVKIKVVESIKLQLCWLLVDDTGLKIILPICEEVVSKNNESIVSFRGAYLVPGELFLVRTVL